MPRIGKPDRNPPGSPYPVVAYTFPMKDLEFFFDPRAQRHQTRLAKAAEDVGTCYISCRVLRADPAPSFKPPGKHRKNEEENRWKQVTLKIFGYHELQYHDLPWTSTINNILQYTNLKMSFLLLKPLMPPSQTQNSKMPLGQKPIPPMNPRDPANLLQNIPGITFEITSPRSPPKKTLPTRSSQRS